MSNYIKKFYYINGEVFDETTSQKSLAFAKKYAKDNNLDESQIYTLVNKSELAYLKELLKREDVSYIVSNRKVELVKGFENYNGDTIPPLEINVSFIFQKNDKKQYVKIIDSVYELNKQFINEKILFDCLFVDNNYLQVYYLDDDKWVEWKIQDIAPFVKEKKEQHKRLLAQKRAIRDRQKFDRLLKLRSEGKITERQTKELYRLEKVFGGNLNG